MIVLPGIAGEGSSNIKFWHSAALLLLNHHFVRSKRIASYMNIVKKCPICGAEFTTEAPRKKYCSTACRRAGEKAVRAAWVQKSGHREKDREAHRVRRVEQKRQRDELERSKDLQRQEESQRKAEEIRADFAARCAAGDIHALMTKAKLEGGNVTAEYWSLFREYQLDINGETFVNGISVYSDSFADDVVQSIQDTGYIFMETKGLR